MKPKQAIAVALVSAALIWASAGAAPEPAEALLESPGVIILELQPMQPGMEAGGADREQALMSMLLLQLLMGMQVESEGAEMQPAAPAAGQRI